MCGWTASVDKKHMKKESCQISVDGIHKQNPKLSPLPHEHTHGYGHSRGGAGSDDVPARCGAFYPHDSRSYGDEVVGQEEGRGNRIVCARPHS
jgi:hypothetical protein